MFEFTSVKVTWKGPTAVCHHPYSVYLSVFAFVLFVLAPLGRRLPGRGPGG